MGRKRKGRAFDGPEAEDFVPAVFARSPEEAEEYREMLNDHDIPAIIHEDDEEKPARPGRPPPPIRKGMTRGVPVLVPEVLLDEASEIIADRDYHDLQPGEDIEDDEEDEDELGVVPAEEGIEADEEEAPGAKSKGRSKPGDSPFPDEEEDAFDLDEEDEGEGLAKELGLDDVMDEEVEDEGEEGPTAE